MAENAMKDVCQLTNPRKATKEQVIGISRLLINKICGLYENGNGNGPVAKGMKDCKEIA